MDSPPGWKVALFCNVGFIWVLAWGLSSKAHLPVPDTEGLKVMVCLSTMSWKVSRRAVLCIFTGFFFLFFSLKTIFLHTSMYFITEYRHHFRKHEKNTAIDVRTCVSVSNGGLLLGVDLRLLSLCFSFRDICLDKH